MSHLHSEDEHYVHHLFGFPLSCYLSGHVVFTCILENVKNFVFESSAWTVRVPSVIQSPWKHVSPPVSRDGHVRCILFGLPHLSTLSTLNLIKEAHWKCLEVGAREFPDAHLIFPASKDIFQGCGSGVQHVRDGGTYPINGIPTTVLAQRKRKYCYF